MESPNEDSHVKSSINMSREDMFNIIKQCELKTLDEKLDFLVKKLTEITKCPDDKIQLIRDSLKSFKHYFKLKWTTASYKECRFRKSNEQWLKGSITIPDWRIPRTARPPKEFRECNERTKRPKTEQISDEEHSQDHSTQSYETEMMEGPENHESSEQLASENERDNSSKRKHFVSPSKSTKKPTLDEDAMLTRAYNILESVSNVPRDECSTFGEYLGTKLQKFNEQRRAILMNKINNLIFEAEMELYSHPQFNQCRNGDYRSPTVSVVSGQCSPAVPEYDTLNQVAHSSGAQQLRELSSP